MSEADQPQDQPHDRPQDQPPTPPRTRPEDAAPSADVTGGKQTAEEPYDVVLLIEQALTEKDAHTIRGLHEAIEAPVRYHVLMPVEDAGNRVEAAMGGLGAGDMLATPPAVLPEADVEAMQAELLQDCQDQVAQSVKVLQAVGAEVTGQSVTADPVEALAAEVTQVRAAEAIIATRRHVIADFFHRDWFHRAERKLGVPVLHLLEHENLDEQAGEGEGVWGF